MAGVNKAFLLGRIGQQPNVLHLQEEDVEQVRYLTVVTQELLKRNDMPTEHQECHHVRVPYNIIVEGAPELLPGQLVHIEGRIHTDRSADGQQQRNYRLEIIASRVIVLG